jgi:hypothetical protein
VPGVRGRGSRVGEDTLNWETRDVSSLPHGNDHAGPTRRRRCSWSPTGTRCIGSTCSPSTRNEF